MKVNPKLLLRGTQHRTVSVQLPWPPSVNHYWRHVGNRTLISREGRAYHQSVAAACATVGHVVGRISVTIAAHPPDRRGRDLDNLLKAILDSLQKAGLFENDAQIDEIILRRAYPAKPGHVNCLLFGAEG